MKLIFFEFSSAFNITQPALPEKKLGEMQVVSSLTTWITDYLKGRPQDTRLQDYVSGTVMSNMELFRGAVSLLLEMIHLRFQSQLSPAGVFS